MNAVPGPERRALAETATRPTVLVVDDTPANLTLMAQVLNKQYRVQVAVSGAKA